MVAMKHEDRFWAYMTTKEVQNRVADNSEILKPLCDDISDFVVMLQIL